MSRIGGAGQSTQSIANAAAAAGDMRDLLRKVDTDDQDRRDMDQDRTKTHDLGEQFKTGSKKIEPEENAEVTDNKNLGKDDPAEEVSSEDTERNSNMTFLVQQKRKYRV